MQKLYEACKQLPEKMLLVDGMAKYDVRKSIRAEIGIPENEPFFKSAYLKATLEHQGHDVQGMTFSKALSTTLSTYAAGTLPVLIPVYVDPEIVDLTRRATPLVELIPRVTNYGRTADYNQISVIATAQALPEDAALTEQDDTYVRRSVIMKYLYSVGRVTGQMFAASKQYLSSGGYVDALSLEVKNKTLSIKRLEEAMILLGDAQADWTEPVNSTVVSGANSFDGLYNLVTDANSNGLGGNSNFGTDNAGAAGGDLNMYGMFLTRQ